MSIELFVPCLGVGVGPEGEHRLEDLLLGRDVALLRAERERA